MALRELYVAVVTGNKDPEERGRVKVKCPALTGSWEYPDWVEPRYPFAGTGTQNCGMLLVPEVGAQVDLEVDHREDGSLIYDGDGLPRPFYRAMMYNGKVPEAFRGDHYPQVGGLQLPDGSALQFDYHEDGQVVRLWQGARGAGPLVELDGKNQTLTLLFKDSRVVLEGSRVLVEGPQIHLGASASYAAARADKVEAELDALKQVFTAWVPAPTDGGALLKTALMVLMPAWALPNSTASDKVLSE